jgi:hypothetical protein
MSEADWLACTDPTPMIRLVVEHPDDRKCRLLACAACRLIWDLLPDPRSRHAVEVAERFADGQASFKDLARARNEAVAAAGGAERQAAWAAYWATNTKAAGPLWNAFAAAAGATARKAMGGTARDLAASWDRHHAAGQASQAELLREVIGNPFRLRKPDPALLSWDNGIIPALARGIYEDEAWDRLPILGDALEEAGCADEALLAHCRGPGRHVRGCWAADLFL